ncbi:MAG: antibiotic biosynthesis monooxygenase family protein [Streptomycetales bacterium]
MGTPHSIDFWRVRTGSEGDFLADWRSFAAWAASLHGFGGSGYLLRDLDEPRQFISVRTWDSVEALRMFRQLPAAQDHLARLREHVDRHSPLAMEDVSPDLGRVPGD